MQIAGLQKLTLIDFPGEVATTVFTRGCNLRCSYCHNPELVIPRHFNPLLDIDSLYSYLELRRDTISGICITGGEPLMHSDIESFIDVIKDMGYKVKLDTNGILHDRLKKLILSGKVDYVAMDIKTSLEKYSILAQTSVSVDRIKKSVNLLISSGVEYEFRTTVYKPHHTKRDFHKIGELIKGAKRYALQNFVLSKHIGNKDFLLPFTIEEINEFQDIMLNFVDEVLIR